MILFIPAVSIADQYLKKQADYYPEYQQQGPPQPYQGSMMDTAITTGIPLALTLGAAAVPMAGAAIKGVGGAVKGMFSKAPAALATPVVTRRAARMSTAKRTAGGQAVPVQTPVPAKSQTAQPSQQAPVSTASVSTSLQAGQPTVQARDARIQRADAIGEQQREQSNALRRDRRDAKGFQDRKQQTLTDMTPVSNTTVPAAQPVPSAVPQQQLNVPAVSATPAQKPQSGSWTPPANVEGVTAKQTPQRVFNGVPDSPPDISFLKNRPSVAAGQPQTTAPPSAQQRSVSSPTAGSPKPTSSLPAFSTPTGTPTAAPAAKPPTTAATPPAAQPPLKIPDVARAMPKARPSPVAPPAAPSTFPSAPTAQKPTPATQSNTVKTSPIADNTVAVPPVRRQAEALASEAAQSPIPLMNVTPPSGSPALTTPSVSAPVAKAPATKSTANQTAAQFPAVEGVTANQTPPVSSMGQSPGHASPTTDLPSARDLSKPTMSPETLRAMPETKNLAAVQPAPPAASPSQPVFTPRQRPQASSQTPTNLQALSDLQNTPESLAAFQGRAQARTPSPSIVNSPAFQPMNSPVARAPIDPNRTAINLSPPDPRSINPFEKMPPSAARSPSAQVITPSGAGNVSAFDQTGIVTGATAPRGVTAGNTAVTNPAAQSLTSEATAIRRAPMQASSKTPMDNTAVRPSPSQALITPEVSPQQTPAPVQSLNSIAPGPQVNTPAAGNAALANPQVTAPQTPTGTAAFAPQASPSVINTPMSSPSFSTPPVTQGQADAYTQALSSGGVSSGQRSVAEAGRGSNATRVSQSPVLGNAQVNRMVTPPDAAGLPQRSAVVQAPGNATTGAPAHVPLDQAGVDKLVPPPVNPLAQTADMPGVNALGKTLDVPVVAKGGQTQSLGSNAPPSATQGLGGPLPTPSPATTKGANPKTTQEITSHVHSLPEGGKFDSGSHIFKKVDGKVMAFNKAKGTVEDASTALASKAQKPRSEMLPKGYTPEQFDSLPKPKGPSEIARAISDGDAVRVGENVLFLDKANNRMMISGPGGDFLPTAGLGMLDTVRESLSKNHGIHKVSMQLPQVASSFKMPKVNMNANTFAQPKLSVPKMQQQPIAPKGLNTPVIPQNVSPVQLPSPTVQISPSSSPTQMSAATGSGQAAPSLGPKIAAWYGGGFGLSNPMSTNVTSTPYTQEQRMTGEPSPLSSTNSKHDLDKRGISETPPHKTHFTTDFIKRPNPMAYASMQLNQAFLDVPRVDMATPEQHAMAEQMMQGQQEQQPVQQEQNPEETTGQQMVPGDAKTAAAWHDPVDLAGLGILAAPHLYDAIHTPSESDKDSSFHQFMTGPYGHRVMELGGLGVLSLGHLDNIYGALKKRFGNVPLQTPLVH